MPESFTQKTWADGPGGGTPLNAAALNDLEARIETIDDRVNTIETNGVGGGGGGYGPNWIAASNAPQSVKDAVLGGGGVVCDGTADQAEFNTALTTYGKVSFTQGTYNLTAQISMPSRRHLQGWGVASEFVGQSGLTGQFIEANDTDHVWLSDFMLSAGNEAAGTHHIRTFSDTQTGYITGADANLIIERIVSRNAKGDGIIVDGINNRDSKISKCHVWNATGRGYYINSPDGNFVQCVAGTCGSHGVEFGVNSANWHASGKMWFSDGDGWLINGARHTICNVEAQDNDLAGFRIVGNLITITDWLADSNSWAGTTALQGVHSGLEIGRTSAGASSGGFNIVVGPGQSWDKNESSRGRCQAYGVRIRSGARGLIMTAVYTGDPADTHFNFTGGILFDTAGDLTNAANFVTACLNHRVRMSS